MLRSPWLVCQPASRPRLRLYCFPYAGGSAASFAGWQRQLDPAIEVCAVQLPGRGVRFLETPERAFAPLVAGLVTAICAQGALPFSFFGHSMGALLAFEVARALQQQGAAMPQCLMVSGCAAPQYRGAARRWHLLSDADLVAALKDYNGTPPEVLANAELMALLLPMIRADFAAVDGYRYRAAAPLALPLTVLAGRIDERVSERQVEGWQEETTDRCQVHWFEGDHFFINSERDAVLACVQDALLCPAG